MILSGTETSLDKLVSIPKVITALINGIGKALKDKNFGILMTSSHRKFRTISFTFSVSAELISYSALTLLEFSFDLQYHLINIIFTK